MNIPPNAFPLLEEGECVWWDVQKYYFNDKFDVNSKKFMDKLLSSTYKRYNDQAKTGFGRIVRISR